MLLGLGVIYYRQNKGERVKCERQLAKLCQ